MRRPPRPHHPAPAVGSEPALLGERGTGGPFGGSRSLNVGLIKAMKDANAGGSGFSFGDLAADAAGDHFALAATRDVPAEVAMQQCVRAGAHAGEFMPDTRDLPEGVFADEFEQHFGGAGGARTDSLVQIIGQRLARCDLLR